MVRWFRRLLHRCVILIILILAVFLLLRDQYDRVIQSLAETQITNTTSDLTNDAIAKQISEGDIRYDRIVYFEKNLDGRITALKTNLRIPLGSLILPQFFSGKGPQIPVHILSIRNSDATFSSNFSQAGINQTIHQLVMVVNIDVAMLVLAKTSSFTVTSEVVVAETVIVGEVPQTFLQTGG